MFKLTVLLEYIHLYKINVVTVLHTKVAQIIIIVDLLEYIHLRHIFSQGLPIMLALCLMLLATYYAQNYAGIIAWSLSGD